jgi:hypothetical protein
LTTSKNKHQKTSKNEFEFEPFLFFKNSYLAHSTGQDINQVIQPGQGLSFIVYPYAVTTIKGAPFWSIMFFIMMLLLGLDTMVTKNQPILTLTF